jgi:predicted  nucleic acid-binding Zn-ribbon protein
MPEDRLVELNVRIEELKRQIDSLRAQQEALVESVQELTKTFRSLAVHLGIATDAYRPATSSSSSRNKAPPEGFG